MSENNTENQLTKVINNPLEKEKKNTDLSLTIWGFSSSKTPDINQITMAMDKYENRLIKRRKVSKLSE